MPPPVTIRGLKVAVESLETAFKPHGPFAAKVMASLPIPVERSESKSNATFSLAKPRNPTRPLPPVQSFKIKDERANSIANSARKSRPVARLSSKDYTPDLDLFRYPQRYRPIPPPVAFVPNNANPEPLINDIIDRISYYRSHPRRQEKAMVLKRITSESKRRRKQRSHQPDASQEEVNKLISEIYRKYIRDTKFPHRDKIVDDEPLQLQRYANAPRKLDEKPYPPPTVAQGIQYVNDIWIALNTIKTLPTPVSLAYQPPPFPGKCPYPELFNQGFRQPRPGAYLRSGSPPERRTKFSSHRDFEAYIYSLAFHRDSSPSTGRMIVAALMKPENAYWLTENAFRYAIVALVERVSDMYSARHLANRMRFVGLDIDTQLNNVFLRGAMKIENLRGFAIILRRMLASQTATADGETWNIMLQMGIKLGSVAWVEAVLDVMQARKIALNLDCLKSVFTVLQDVLDVDKLDEFYRAHCDGLDEIPWKLFHVLLDLIAQQHGLDAAWQRLLEACKKSEVSSVPVEATLNLFLRKCFHFNDYERAWIYLRWFKTRWNVQVNPETLEILFRFAVKQDRWEDALLVYKFSCSQHLRLEMRPSLIEVGNRFEREMGIPLDRMRWDHKETVKAWNYAISGRREFFPFPKIQEEHRQYAELVRAAQIAAQLPQPTASETAPPVPTAVSRWREICDTYHYAVKMGAYRPKRTPPTIPPASRDERKYYSIKGYRRRVKVQLLAKHEGGKNFRIREMIAVWKMVKDGSLKVIWASNKVRKMRRKRRRWNV